MKPATALGVLTAALLAACGGATPRPAEPAAATSTAAPPPPSNPPATSTAAPPLDAPDAGQSWSQTTAAPPPPAPGTLVLTPQGAPQCNPPPSRPGMYVTPTLSVGTIRNIVQLEVQNFLSFCSPTPSFTVTREGNLLRLTETMPQGVSRCFCLHRLGFNLEGLPPGSYTMNLETNHAADHPPERVASVEFTLAPTP